MTDPRPSRSVDRLLRGYGPLLGFAAVFLAISLIVPTQKQKVTVASAAAANKAAGTTGLDDSTTSEDLAAAAGATGPGATGTAGDPNSTAAQAARAAQAAAARKAALSGAAAAAGSQVPGNSTSCGAFQVNGDPYSPPCVKWSGGNNGGATSKGVTATSVKVAVRIQAFSNGIADALSKVANAKIPSESDAKIESTIQGIVDYFNRYYQFYGRKLDLSIFSGKGDLTQEILGGGPEGALADALNVSDKIGAFADVSAESPPYADALSKQGVVNIGAPYISRDYFTRLRPYAWSPLTDCSTVVETVGSYYLAKLAGKSATHARGNLQGQPRKTAIIAPNNSWYQECVNEGIALIKKGGAGSELAMDAAYRIDINDLLNQANDLIAKMKSQNITTVICGCDPILMAYLTQGMHDSGYYPEIVETGVAFTDLDLVGQIMNGDAMKGSFGVSFNGQTTPIRGGPGYRAFKAIHPDQEPSQAADLIYYQVQLLAIGVELAGPNLTPQTFEQGMFRYPTRTGPAGTWKFGPGDYTTSQDAREIYWSPTTTSPQNGDPGAWVDPSGGKARYAIGAFPAGDPPGGG